MGVPFRCDHYTLQYRIFRFQYWTGVMGSHGWWGRFCWPVKRAFRPGRAGVLGCPGHSDNLYCRRRVCLNYVFIFLWAVRSHHHRPGT